MNKLLTILSVIMLTKNTFRDYGDACQPYNAQRFFIYTGHEANTSIEWDIIAAFTSGKGSGAGGFGEVRMGGVLFNTERIAIKKISISNFNIAELNCLYALRNSNYAPKFYGCQYENGSVYVAQAHFKYTLADPEWRSIYKTFELLQKMDFTIHLIAGLKDLWEINMVHNDIKPENLMTDFYNVNLIDFGIASSTNSGITGDGTLHYMPPIRFGPPVRFPRPNDDLFALALTIGEINSDNGKKDFFSDPTQTPPLYLPGTVLGQYFPTESFLKTYEANLVNFLSKAGFGNYIPSVTSLSDENINFTTIIVKLLLFSFENLKYDNLLEACLRLYRLEKNKKNNTEQKLQKPIGVVQIDGEEEAKVETADEKKQRLADTAAFKRFYRKNGFVYTPGEALVAKGDPTDEQINAMTKKERLAYFKTQAYFKKVNQNMTADRIREMEAEEKAQNEAAKKRKSHRNLAEKDKIIII